MFVFLCASIGFFILPVLSSHHSKLKLPVFSPFLHYLSFVVVIVISVVACHFSIVMSDIVTVLDRIVIVTAANAVVVVAIVVACCHRRCCLCCDISAASFVILVLHCRHSRPICNRRKTAANPESKPIRQKPEYWLLLLPHGNIQERDIPATA